MRRSHHSLSLRPFSFQSCVNANSSDAQPEFPPTASIGCMEGSVIQQIKRILSSSRLGKISSSNAIIDMGNGAEVGIDTSIVAGTGGTPFLSRNS